MTNYDSTFTEIVEAATLQNASDIHFIVGSPPIIRRDGSLYALNGQPISAEMIINMLGSIVDATRYQKFTEHLELDFSIGWQTTRLRINAYYQQDSPAMALRLIPSVIPSLEQLGVPDVMKQFLKISQGFIIVSGPTGHGKSTSLASMIDSINAERSEHIITLEDPVEYTFTPKKSIVSQREVGTDTPDFTTGLRAALREDPNIILVGEMRDRETVETAMTIAETGHLVFATLHTNSAAQTADRIIDAFPEDRQSQARSQFSNVLTAIISQRLLPKISGGRILVSEVMIANSAIRSLIRDNKIHEIPNVIQTSAADGMISLDARLAELVKRGEISMDEAQAWANDPKSLNMLLYS